MRAPSSARNPEAEHTTARGTQLVRGVPVDETEMREDPQTPVLEAHVPTLLGDAFSSVGTLGVEDLADPERVRLALEENECVVADAERDSDLEALVRTVPDPARVLWAGSAGLAYAIGSVYPGPRAGDVGERRAPACPVLVVVGSLSGVAREQVRRLVEEYGDVSVEAAGEDAVAAAREALSGGTCAVVHSPEEQKCLRRSGRRDVGRGGRPSLGRAALRGAHYDRRGDGRRGGAAAWGDRDRTRRRGGGGGARGSLDRPESVSGGHEGRRLRRTGYTSRGSAGARAGRGGEPMTPPLIAVTMGDPAGIGPEILARTFADKGLSGREQGGRRRGREDAGARRPAARPAAARERRR